MSTVNWRPISEIDRHPVRVALLHQSTDCSIQQIEWNVLFDYDLGGSFVRQDGEVYSLSENGHFATHFATPFDVPPPDRLCLDFHDKQLADMSTTE